MILLLLASLALDPHEINGAESVEWMVYDSDLIIVGEVVETSPIPENGSFERATVRVREVLKGDLVEAVKLTWRYWEEKNSAAAHLRHLTPLILFLVRSERYVKDSRIYADSPYALRGTGSQTAAYPMRGSLRYGLFDCDFKEHRTPEAMVGAVRAALQAMDKRKPNSFQLWVPCGSDVFSRLYGGSAVYLVVPLDSAMHRRALAWRKRSGPHPATRESLLRRISLGDLGDLPEPETIEQLIRRTPNPTLPPIRRDALLLPPRPADLAAPLIAAAAVWLISVLLLSAAARR